MRLCQDLRSCPRKQEAPHEEGPGEICGLVFVDGRWARSLRPSVAYYPHIEASEVFLYSLGLRFAAFSATLLIRRTPPSGPVRYLDCSAPFKATHVRKSLAEHRWLDDQWPSAKGIRVIMYIRYSVRDNLTGVAGNFGGASGRWRDTMVVALNGRHDQGLAVFGGQFYESGEDE